MNDNTFSEGANERSLDVALICMPFASWKQPSLGLSILNACLKVIGFNSRVFYFTLKLSYEIGSWLYDKIASWHIVDLLGEWIFSGSIFPRTDKQDRYIEDILQGAHPAHAIPYFGKEPLSREILEEILDLRNNIDIFLSDCAAEIRSYNPRVIGFTNLFHQQLASLSLAKKLKNLLPSAHIVMGGPNCRWPMGAELIKNFSSLDSIISGEGETIFPKFVERIMAGLPISDLRGVITKDNLDDDGNRCSPILQDLNSIPYPDYSDFREQWEKYASGEEKGRVLFETSRGCWWGQKKSRRCLFCSQGNETLRYRKKSPVRTVEELSSLSKNFSDFSVCFTDEAVDPVTLKNLASDLKERHALPDIIYIQVRPDLGKRQIELLKSAGVRRLEVGIETLSTKILNLIRKGVKAIQNIAFLKWCQELEIEPVWNFLWGFPGEPPVAYQTIASLIPLVVHLQPPNYVGKFRLERYSPYFDSPDKYGLNKVKPLPVYSYLYPFEEKILNNLAYFFTFDSLEPHADNYIENISELISIWKSLFPRAHLKAADFNSKLVISDRRGVEERIVVLGGLNRELYLACDEIRTEGELTDFLKGIKHPESQKTLEEVLTPLLEQGLMLKEGNQFLSLAVIE